MPIRVSIYARYSIDLQNERSIEDQVALCRRVIEAENLVEADVFADRIRTSATIVGRAGLEALFQAVEKGQIDMVLVECLDRISRDQADLPYVYKKLNFFRVVLREVQGGVANEISVGVRGLVGTLALKDIKDKIRRRFEGNVERGLSAGGRAYSYGSVLGKPGELQIVPDEACVIVEIFQRYLSGETPRDIAHQLNERRVPPPRGARWNASTIIGSADRSYGVLRNSIYNGVRVWNRVQMVLHPDSGKRVSRVKAVPSVSESWGFP